MCGLAGRFHPVALPPDPNWATRVDALLAHRGPDGRGHYADARCELVHRRLALLDLSPAGSQPMPNEDGMVQVVFNGEIYTHRELRAELKSKGHVFRGSSDTEVLVHLYEEHGADLVSRLRGMFAFAILDRRHNRVILARDRFGIKPLFCATHDGQWVFASEMKAILALQGFRPELDRQACYDFLGLSYIPEPATGFANIFALAKGTTLIVDERGPRTTRFASVSAQPAELRPRATLAQAASELLLEAVERQAVADVPVAALLSGGIDSSLVVAAHARSSGRAITTFNVSFPDRAHDETAMALATARRYGTNHHTIRIDDRDITADSVFDLLRHFDQPFADPSLVPMYRVARAVREHGIICTFTGDGGDEAFGGYSEFWRAERLVRLASAPRWMLATAGGIARPLAGWTRDAGRQVTKAVQLAQAVPSRGPALLAGLLNYLTETEKEELVQSGARADLRSVHRHFGTNGRGASDIEALSAGLTSKHFDVSLPSDMLRKVDMMSMRAGIEVRVPMLDEEVVGLALSLPHRMKTDGRTGKLVLRDVAADWLPPQVASHPKHGFTIPLDVMVRADFHQAASDLLEAADSRTATFVNRGLVRGWLQQFRASTNGGGGGFVSREGLYLRVFMLLALELWMRDQRLTW
ncbi:MAG TPA: asparagine synthase (glutamine-hydrolyzing) [Gemmatimonadales bacterium]|nr:asparagine synthase (glutamine-hydrolyzing) [Gemmatimonadales bacterium]